MSNFILYSVSISVPSTCRLSVCCRQGPATLPATWSLGLATFESPAVPETRNICASYPQPAHTTQQGLLFGDLPHGLDPAASFRGPVAKPFQQVHV